MSTGQDGTRPDRQPTDLDAVGGPDGIEHLVRALMMIMRDGGLTKLDLKLGSLSVSLRGNGTGVATGDGATQGSGPGAPAEPEPAPEHVITAPMIGTYYASPAPGAPSFVEVGDRVAIGQVIGIIEAMKIMNEIVADQAGQVAAILATNGQPVEYGSPLLLLAPNGRSL